MATSEALKLANRRALTCSGRARDLRERARLSLSEVASDCQVDVTTVWRWEQGKRRPRGAAALRYAALLSALDRQ